MKITTDQLKGDFLLFVKYVWYLLDLPQPTKVQLLIADFMADEKNPDRIIQAFRGVGKSYLCYAYVVWKLWNDPDLKFLVISAAKDRADMFSNTCQQLIELIPQLNHLRPKDRDTVWTRVKWTVAGAKVSGSPSVVSKGIDSTITGGRADFIIVDDAESPANAFTVDRRDKLKVQVQEFEAIRKGDEGKGNVSQVIYLGTPQCEESLYNHLRDESGYKVRVWTARYPRIDKIGDYKGTLCPVLEDELFTNPSLEWEPTDAGRFTEADLVSRAMKYGKAGFSLQFMLDTALSDAERYPLRTSDLVVFQPADTKAPRQVSHGKNRESTLQDLPRVGFSSDRWYKPIYIDSDYEEWEGSVMAIDPSGRGNDETSYCVIKNLMGTLYVTRSGGLEGGYDEDKVLKPLAMIAREEGVNKVIIESNFGDGMYTQLFKPILHAVHPCQTEEVSHHTQKERRIIDTLEPVMARHKLVVTPEVIEEDHRTAHNATRADGKTKEAYSLFHQMTRITYDKGSLVHDDRLDALAIAVAFFTERMARDLDREVDHLRKSEMDKLLKKKYAKALTISQTSSSTWVHKTDVNKANLLNF
jgi:hypothetical protein